MPAKGGSPNRGTGKQRQPETGTPAKLGGNAGNGDLFSGLFPVLAAAFAAVAFIG